MRWPPLARVGYTHTQTQERFQIFPQRPSPHKVFLQLAVGSLDRLPCFSLSLPFLVVLSSLPTACPQSNHWQVTIVAKEKGAARLTLVTKGNQYPRRQFTYLSSGAHEVLLALLGCMLLVLGVAVPCPGKSSSALSTLWALHAHLSDSQWPHHVRGSDSDDVVHISREQKHYTSPTGLWFFSW